MRGDYILGHSGVVLLGAWENPDYFWVVICKNTKAHPHTSVLDRTRRTAPGRVHSQEEVQKRPSPRGESSARTLGSFPVDEA
jgi:hypothetical protein